MFYDDGYFDSLDDFDHYNPWRFSNEKSKGALAREETATAKFHAVREKVDPASLTNKARLIGLATKPESESIFRRLPADSVENILGYVRGKTTDTDGKTDAAAVAALRPTRVARAAKKSNKASKDDDNDDGKEELDLRSMMKDLAVPGRTIVIPLLTPDIHLTSACWRDFSRAVRAHDGWNAKRIAATPDEKKKFKEYRKGSVYFVQVMYTVPGGPVKKKRAAPKKKKATAADGITTTNEESAAAVGDIAEDNKIPATKKAKTVASFEN